MAIPLRCPQCACEISSSRWIGHVAVCANCGACCAIEDGQVVPGTGAHVDQLTPDDLATLRTHRRPFIRTQRR